MKRFLLYIFTLLAIASCSKNKIIDPIIDPDTTKSVSDGTLENSCNQTTLIYFMGTNLRSYFNTNISDAQTAIASGALGKGGRFLYLIPTSYYSATLYELIQNGDECYKVEVKSYTFNSLLSSSVTEVINDVKDHVDYSTGSMSLNMVVSGHGTGWVLQDHPSLKSIATTESIWDKAEGALQTRFLGCSSDGYMDIEDLLVGIEDSDTKLGFLLFDMCFMSNIEALYRLRECSEYIVASPCEVMGTGFPYTYVLPNFYTDNGYNFDMVAVCEAYNNYYTYIASYKYGCVAMCVTSELDELVDAMKGLTYEEEIDTTELQSYEQLTDHVFYDFGDFINQAYANDINLEAFNEQFDYTFPKAARLNTDQYYTALTGTQFGAYSVDYYSGVTTSDPSVKFRDDWALEPWVIDTGRYLSIE
ncbi:MAG: clostripain-related cysteine peptidase [Rikenellaceae bacterium]